MKKIAFCVRRAAPADFDEACGLIHEYYEAIGVLVREDRAELEQYLLGAASGIWLARRCFRDAGNRVRMKPGDAPIGCILLRPLPQKRASGEIKRLYVRAEYRGQGVARALLRALERSARRRGQRWLYLDSKDDLKAALWFYRQSGYEPCARYNENPQATVFMRKRLR